MEHFWTELAKLIGPLSATVRGALEQTKFIHAGLAYLDENAIDRIENDIRQLPAMLQKPEAEVAAQIGNYPGDIKNFQFLTGERAYMLMIAAKVTQHGFHRFFRGPPQIHSPILQLLPPPAPHSPIPQLQAPPPPPPSPPSLLVPLPLEKPEVIIPMVEVVHNTAMDKDSEEQVKAKIFDYYERRRNNFPEEESFFVGLRDLQVEIRHDYIGDMARIVCPFCDPATVGSILIRRDRSGAWKVSNFSAHIKMKHDELVYPGKEAGVNGASEEFSRKGGRKRSRSFIQNVPLEEDFMDEHSQMEMATVKCELTEW